MHPTRKRTTYEPALNQVQFIKSSTGESDLTTVGADHTQSEKVLALKNSIYKHNKMVHREETTSSESPVRPIAISPLIKPIDVRRSGRFSSHE